MKKYILIIFIIILLMLCSFCNIKEIANEEESDISKQTKDGVAINDSELDSLSEIDNKTKTEKVGIEKLYFNTTNNNIDDIVVDGDKIYCVSDGKIYCLNQGESEKRLIYDSQNVIKLRIYNDKLIFLTLDYSKEVPSKLYSIEKDGTDFKEINIELDFTRYYYVIDFSIYKDTLIFTLQKEHDNYDIKTPTDTYAYDFDTEKLSSIYVNLQGDRYHTIEDKIYYYRAFNSTEDNVLHKYDLENDIKESVCINRNSHKEKFITSRLHFQDNFVYYSGKTYIDKDNITESLPTQTIFEDDSYTIVDMVIFKNYIFFINIEEENIYEETAKICIYRINIDGSDKIQIFTENVEGISKKLFQLKAIKDNILLYQKSGMKSQTDIIIDFEGNVLDEEFL